MLVAVAGVKPTPENRLLLVDGHALAYRSFFAIKNLRSPNGEPTNAIYGFIKSLDRYYARLKPQYVHVVWDGGLAEQRLALLPGYKAQRPEMPDDLRVQLDFMVEYLKSAGISNFRRDGVEADDWIATVARKTADSGCAVVIASPDKDFMQLVSERIGLYNPNDKTDKVWTAADVVDKAGVQPWQVVDWLSLVGDAVDNIPGVTGVGPKTATELLVRFGTVAALYSRLAEVKSERVRAALVGAQANVIRNQELIKLNERMDWDGDLAECEVKKPDQERLYGLYARWGFKSLVGSLSTRTPEQAEMLFG